MVEKSIKKEDIQGILREMGEGRKEAAEGSKPKSEDAKKEEQDAESLKKIEEFAADQEKEGNLEVAMHLRTALAAKYKQRGEDAKAMEQSAEAKRLTEVLEKQNKGYTALQIAAIKNDPKIVDRIKKKIFDSEIMKNSEISSIDYQIKDIFNSNKENSVNNLKKKKLF